VLITFYYCVIISQFEISVLLNISYDFPKIRNIPTNIFLRSFKNVAPGFDLSCAYVSSR